MGNTCKHKHMKIFLLTHQRELERTTNTGSLAIEHAGSVVERIVWQRDHPNADLINFINNNEVLLLHQQENNEPAKIPDYDSFIILDGTWQESRKIYNKSDYLKKATSAALNLNTQSEYKLRRNQVSNGLCTIECVIELLRLKGKDELASKLYWEFSLFNAKRE